MAKKPPVSELEFLKLTGNHHEFSRKISKLGIVDSETIEYAGFVAIAWFALGKEHLTEARRNIRSRSTRTVYSRSYYAAYNASKGVRYMVNGLVSLKGDDHGKASIDLPNDFPNIASWATKINLLYEHRLRADYDNWATTNTDHSLKPREAVKLADEFIEEARVYLNGKFDLKL